MGPEDGPVAGNSDGAANDENDPNRFDRLPETAADRTVEGRATRQEVLDWWDERFDVPPATFDAHTFWERGAGKIWAFCDDFDRETPVGIEGLGMTVLRTRQEHWKPTLEAAQRWGSEAFRNVIHLTRDEAETFLAGDDQELDWDGDWGYLIAAHGVVGEPEPIGVGLFVYGELRSQVPKGRRREF